MPKVKLQTGEGGLGRMNIQTSSKFDGPGLDNLAPVTRETVQDRIYRQLRDALIQGRFDAGEIFLAGDVAQRMSVSSMPVREALARLVSERALEAMANRRVRVPLLTLERARDIAQARTLIEGELAARAIANLTDADIEQLEALTAEYEATREAQDVATLNHAIRAGDTVQVSKELTADISQSFAILERADPDFWVAENGAAS